MNTNTTAVQYDSKSDLNSHGILELMEKVAKWQIDNLPLTMELPCGIIEPLTAHHWVRSAFLCGVFALWEKSQNEAYLDFLLNQCEGVEFKIGERLRHADEFAIGKLYTDLYLLKQDSSMLDDLQERVDDILENPSRGPEVGWENEKNWAWCDSLFMAPPAWLKLYTCTGKRKYLNEMNELFWETVDYLYSAEDHLFYRDGSFIVDKNGSGPKSQKGEKIFWSRGNGWVIGGLCDLLTYIPGDFPDRPRYEKLFRKMIDRLIELRGEDGMWRSSLLDPEEFPAKEFSGSAFFTLGIAWGINHKMLDFDRYWPVVKESWQALCKCVAEDGRINWVQKVGADPASVSEKDTMEYGPGAFLLLGKEMIELLAL